MDAFAVMLVCVSLLASGEARSKASTGSTGATGGTGAIGSTGANSRQKLIEITPIKVDPKSNALAYILTQANVAQELAKLFPNLQASSLAAAPAPWDSSSSPSEEDEPSSSSSASTSAATSAQEAGEAGEAGGVWVTHRGPPGLDYDGYDLLEHLFNDGHPPAPAAPAPARPHGASHHATQKPKGYIRNQIYSYYNGNHEGGDHGPARGHYAFTPRHVADGAGSGESESADSASSDAESSDDVSSDAEWSDEWSDSESGSDESSSPDEPVGRHIDAAQESADDRLLQSLFDLVGPISSASSEHDGVRSETPPPGAPVSSSPASSRTTVPDGVVEANVTPSEPPAPEPLASVGSHSPSPIVELLNVSSEIVHRLEPVHYRVHRLDRVLDTPHRLIAPIEINSTDLIHDASSGTNLQLVERKPAAGPDEDRAAGVGPDGAAGAVELKPLEGHIDLSVVGAEGGAREPFDPLASGEHTEEPLGPAAAPWAPSHNYYKLSFVFN